MNETERKKLTHASWPQIAVVAALVAVLVAVIVMQMVGRSRAETTSPAPSPTGSSRSTPASPATATTDHPADPPSEDPWNQTFANDTIAYDPFRIPAAFSNDGQSAAGKSHATAVPEDDEDDRAARLEAARAAREAALARLSKQGFKAFLAGREPDGNVGVIGKQTVRVGDVLDGFRVIAIEPGGIVVEPAEGR